MSAQFEPRRMASVTSEPLSVAREALDYPVMFNPAPAVARWRRLRGAMWWSIGSLVVGIGIWVGIWGFTRDTSWSDISWWFVGISLGISLIFLGRAIFRWLSARRELRLVAEGLALGIGRGGLFIEGRFIPWTGLGRLETRPARIGRTARLLIRPTGGGLLTLPLDYLGAAPAVLDGAVLALSGGRARIDLSRLDA